MGSRKQENRCAYPAGRKAENKARKIKKAIKAVDTKRLHRMRRIELGKGTLKEFRLAIKHNQIDLKKDKQKESEFTSLLNRHIISSRNRTRAKQLVMRSPFALLYELKEQ